MNDILSTPSSYYWVDHGPASDYPPLRGEVTAEVAVIGTGMVGLTAALLLQQQGRRVTVLEAKRVGEQTIGGSTAAELGLLLSRLALQRRRTGDPRASGDGHDAER